MLRADRSRFSGEFDFGGASAPLVRELLLAVATAPKSRSNLVPSWPEWLVPAYRSGGHRPNARSLKEER